MNLDDILRFTLPFDSLPLSHSIPVEQTGTMVYAHQMWGRFSFHHAPVLWENRSEIFYEPTSSGATLSQLETCADELKEIAEDKLEKKCQIKRQQARAEERSQSGESAVRVGNFKDRHQLLWL